MYRLLIAILLVLFVTLQYRLWVGKGSLSDVSQLQQQIVNQRSDLERLRQTNAELRADVDDLRLGNEAIEERARTDLGMIKNGEIFYQIVNSSTDR